MISFDTNILFFAYAEDRCENAPALAFLNGHTETADVFLCEFVLVELYRLLRNPAVLKQPLRPKEAVEVIQIWRKHPRWTIGGFSPESRRLHDELWQLASQRDFATRRIFDARLGLVLRHHGVTEFATANVKDFQGFGFTRVWNPLE